ncbi:DUF222 domain-containing protein, partial [Blastococcus jejuensis]|uniref:DUF222 domain-containing protein n=1 Tax=Blastococcus jejuensis TaxID=351224 RepID=UPI0031E3075E
MGELASALDALAADDLHALPAGAQLDRVADLVQLRNRVDAEIARSVRVAETTLAPEHDGLKSMASWLAGHCRLARTTAAQIVRAGRVGEQLPSVAAAFAQGLVNADQVAVIAPVAQPENLAKAADQGIDLGAVDTVLAQTATAHRHDRLRQVVQHYLARLDPDGPEPDPTEGRSLSIAKHADGSITGRFALDAVGGEKVQAVLESFVQKDRPAGDLRTRAQQLGDALVQWADVTLAAGQAPVLRTVKPHVSVLIGIDDLVAPGTGPAAAQMGFGALISAARARWLACDGTISRVIMGPDGRVLDLGRDVRITPPHLRRAVELSDRHCIFTGCGAPTHWCEVDLPRSGGHRSQRRDRRGRVSSWVGSIPRSSATKSSSCTGAM